ncbi:aminotransferase class III-fold pyridoxal phosphate-dependent enzyme [Nocardioides sp. HDW12B]|uniref:aminotransferase class III-fold pyridoxal phosphate-dependent enzyme n=1 Tax=Nocardioides sp. HDW12B TaxID=2714939 RepID=UPI00140895A3|nr:aminotransferase class III-fold pyridoxal phosphate-dependent enzyme [Nocardioides sp. HDW12B]QIK66280.1 aminotransferase class III-fold pyridoxal phosphate-dependent enzyme [Nocardioides sp. HDW12B]
MADALDAALVDAVRRYVESNPESARLARAASEVLPGGNTRSVLHTDPFGVRVIGAEGAVLTTADGARVVDLLGDYSAGLLGHSSVVADAVQDVLRRGWGYGAMSEPETEFARALVDRFASIDQVRFTNSGSEANLMAVLTARHVTGRDRIVVFEGAYHGGPMTFLPGSEPLRVPFTFSTLPYNDVAAVQAELAERGEEIACVLVEPMLGAGGCIPATVEFLAGIRQATRERGALMVMDEVMTSRLAVGGAQEVYGVEADLTVLGKYFGGGFSFGAFGGSRDVMAAFDPARGGLTHGGTFNNNAFTMAVGPVVAGLLDAETLAELNGRGDDLREHLSQALAPVGFCVTGTGSMMTIHPTPGPVARWSDLAGVDPRWRRLLFLDLLDRGFYIAERGYLALSLAVSGDELDAFVEAARASAAAYREVAEAEALSR